MDHQPLNTGEQKDMAEFFIDLVSKLEEMTPELKTLVKTLFCGVLSNNVVSLVSWKKKYMYFWTCIASDYYLLYLLSNNRIAITFRELLKNFILSDAKLLICVIYTKA